MAWSLSAAGARSLNSWSRVSVGPSGIRSRSGEGRIRTLQYGLGLYGSLMLGVVDSSRILPNSPHAGRDSAANPP